MRDCVFLETYTSGTTPKRNKQINRVSYRTIIVYVSLVLIILMQNLDIVVFNHESTFLIKILLEQVLNEDTTKASNKHRSAQFDSLSN